MFNDGIEYTLPGSCLNKIMSAVAKLAEEGARKSFLHSIIDATISALPVTKEPDQDIEGVVDEALAGIEKYGGGCMGPSYPTEEEVDSVTNSVISYLAKVHHLLDIQENEMLGRGDALNKLRDAIKDVMWQDNCEKF